VCAATGLVATALRRAGLDRVSLGRNAGRALALGLAAAALVALVAAHPLRRVHGFAQTPASGNGDFVQSHLLSSSGSGRWQFWTAAVDAFRTQPLRGRGAGSFESWWAQHGNLPDFIRNAHSLYLEVLAELGIVGLGLLGGAVCVGLVAGARRIRTRPAERDLQAALVAAFLAFALAAAVDWIWQLAAVGAVGIALLALALADAEAPARRSPSRLRVAVAAAGLVLVVAQAVPLLAELRLERSHAAVRRGDTESALAAALDARDIEPWAASPYLQLALVTEQAGAPAVAHVWIERALARDRTDWRLWLVKARLETRLGHVRAAAASLARATALDPRSPLFRG
jgi:O-antigen ligase